MEPLTISSGLLEPPRPNLQGSATVGSRRLVRGLCSLSRSMEPPKEPPSLARRDKLLENEQQVRQRWEQTKVFEADALDKPPKDGEKFFGNFPYPYMNGMLHLGHAFSLSKLEFVAAYWRLCGSNSLFPMGFHTTGMPIKACADKLAREMIEFGNPPVFPVETKLATDIETVPQVAETTTQETPDKFKSTKSKVAAKTGTAKYQWEIMRSFGLNDKEIPKFKDPLYWLTYFPPIAIDDLKQFGLGCDWRRSFITTEANPYYDSFVRWQFERLRANGKVVKDVRYAVYSMLDGQPCADHDRAKGEGVLPQEYVLIKMEVRPPFTGKLQVFEGKRIFLAAATLRPETMYGQTNAWVLAEGDYGAFEVNDEEIVVVTKRAARNMACQRIFRKNEDPHEPTCLVELKGQDLIGLPVVAPLSKNPVVYVLPMLNVKTDKGTGIVTSVPSDSPDDYMALQDLKAKPALRAKYGVTDEMVLPYEVIPIINIPEFGDRAAEKICQSMKIKSQNDRDNLEEAKKKIYLKGFTEGTMLEACDKFSGMKVQDAKPLIKKLLVQSGEAMIYSEPEKPVQSRSGDDCVVALTDQWYLNYGEEEWRAAAEKCLSRMNLYSEETRHGFEHTLGWLNQWACSRSFGLGTKFPWDPDFLIESLSDSTIYMAYYTVAHILQEGDLYGTTSSHPVKPEQMTPQVWEYVFGSGPFPDSTIPEGTLKKMRREFDYWYPFDLRTSGKDLIQNHLTFSIYNHVALFPEEKWPRSFRCNGMILLNGEKMSKSTGNFMTIKEAIDQFTSDATRFALADAGDGLDDANFLTSTAYNAVLRLSKEITWMEEVYKAVDDLRQGPPSTFADRVFDNAINIAIHQTGKNYREMMFREALKSGFFDFQLARDEYRLACASSGMNKELIFRFMDVQTRLLTPICPHFSEHVRFNIFQQDGFAVKAGWPESKAPDMTLQRANKFLQDTIISFRNSLQKHLTGPRKKAKKEDQTLTPAPASAPKVVGLVFVAEKYEGWKEECLTMLQSCYNKDTGTFIPDAEILDRLRQSSLGQAGGDFKQVQKKCMPFIRFKKEEALTIGPHALDVKLAFDEMAVLQENADIIKQQVGLEDVLVLSFNDPSSLKKAGSQASAVQKNPPSPGSCSIVFLSVSDLVETVAGIGIAEVTI